MENPWTEDLIWQAQRGLELGRVLCTCDGHYHTLWGTIRASGASNGLKSEEPLLTSLLRPFVRDGARVLIGGAADPGVLCTIGRIYAPVIPALTVIDRCKAPLELVRQFATMKGIVTKTLNLNLLDLDGREQWDQIVLHYTPDFVDPPLHGRLFKALARALAPGGIVVCAAMTATGVIGEREHEVGGVYYDYTLRRVLNGPMADIAASAEFQDMLRTYSVRWGQRRTNLSSHEQLTEAMGGAGLSLLSQNSAPRQHRTIGGSTLVDSCWIIIAGRNECAPSQL
jgi:SAM-dependent methyltransferase